MWEYLHDQKSSESKNKWCHYVTGSRGEDARKLHEDQRGDGEPSGGVEHPSSLSHGQNTHRQDFCHFSNNFLHAIESDNREIFENV